MGNRTKVNNKKIILLSLLGLILALFVFLFLKYIFLENKGQKSPPTTLSTAKEAPLSRFEKFDFENLRLNKDDNLYSIKQGEVFKNSSLKVENKEKIGKLKRLAMFYLWSKEDPLLTSPDFDFVNFAKSLEILDKDSKELFKLSGLEDNIFPISFLSKMQVVASNHSAFMNNISEQNAVSLLDSLDKAVTEYEKEAKYLHIKVSSVKKDENFIFLPSLMTNRAIVMNDLGKIVENAKKLSSEVGIRKECFYEDSFFCVLPKLSLEKPIRPGEDDFSWAPYLMNKDKLFYPIEYKNSLFEGPYQIETKCIKPANSSLGDKQLIYTAVSDNNLLNTPIQFFKSATNNYYSNNFDPKILDKLKNKNAKYKPMPETNPYACVDFEYLPKVAVINSFFLNYKNNLIFEGIQGQHYFNDLNKELQKTIKEGMEAENNFFNKDYPTLKDLEYLSEVYFYVYSKMLSQNFFDENLQEELLNRYLIVNRGLSDFDLLFNNFTYYYINLLKRYSLAGTKFSEDQIYLTRTAYSLTFFPFSSSVWRISDKLKYYNILEEKTDSPFTDYKSAILKYSEKEVLSWNENNNMPQIYEQLIQERLKN
ncbi:hypothetical protein HOD96_02390 [Candidatus Falkowbacteria bacterium]|jgi:hypothetical protein|nr:hypothetical protein [Candidatus Falkowbacteria bacterium]MBT4433445.1 hypothetical protein [Candidatus Falkowbacteria bacterium]